MLQPLPLGLAHLVDLVRLVHLPDLLHHSLLWRRLPQPLLLGLVRRSDLLDLPRRLLRPLLLGLVRQLRPPHPLLPLDRLRRHQDRSLQ